jgi:hypothetical protein
MREALDPVSRPGLPTFASIRSLSAIALFTIRSIVAFSDGGSIRGLQFTAIWVWAAVG